MDFHLRHQDILWSRYNCIGHADNVRRPQRRRLVHGYRHHPGTRTSYGVTDTITGLAPVDSYGGNDNELFALPDLQLTDNGMTFIISSFADGNDGNQVNIFSGYGYAEYSGDDAGRGTFTATPVTRKLYTRPRTLHARLVVNPAWNLRSCQVVQAVAADTGKSF